MFKDLTVSFETNNGLVVKKGNLIHFIVKEDNITYCIITTGFNLYEIPLDKVKIIKED